MLWVQINVNGLIFLIRFYYSFLHFAEKLIQIRKGLIQKSVSFFSVRVLMQFQIIFKSHSCEFFVQGALLSAVIHDWRRSNFRVKSTCMKLWNLFTLKSVLLRLKKINFVLVSFKNGKLARVIFHYSGKVKNILILKETRIMVNYFPRGTILNFKNFRFKYFKGDNYKLNWKLFEKIST